jgi:hypothetical protein
LSGGSEVRKRAFVGLILLLLGAGLFLSSLLKTTTIYPAIDTSFVVEQGEMYDDEGTYYHTRILGKSVLNGEISVEGEGIYLTAIGTNAYEIENIFIDNYYNFTVDPADDLYYFTFDNTNGDAESHVDFVLEEEFTSLALQSPIMLIRSLVGIFLLLPIGIILILWGITSKKENNNDFSSQNVNIKHDEVNTT